MFWRKCGKRSAEARERIERTLKKKMRAKICNIIPPGVKQFVIFRPF